jgi:nicotinamidase-related amidase
MPTRLDLLIIDPQNSFCDPAGELFVPGADADMDRLAAMILRLKDRLSDIHVTMDSHRLLDVAHPLYWKDSSGNHPDPFTIISAADVADGRWTPSIPGLSRRALEYVRALEQGGRYPLCIWPPHCLIGSWGHQIYTPVLEALHAWEEQLALVDFVTKGSNFHTEHYSGIKAEVPDPKDPSTQINTRLVDTLLEADVILVAGEAGSHCLANTVRDIAAAFGDDKYVQKLVLLTDATSPVPLPAPLDTLQEDFIKEMTARGMQTSTTETFGL